MKRILLGGNSFHNQSWIEEVRQRIGGDVQEYRHWKTGEPMIDFGYEASVLAMAAKDEPMTVFAKSAGCLVAMKAARELGVVIDRAVFVGFPYHWGIERGIDVALWLKEWNIPTLFAQKENDPAIGGEELREMLPSRGKILIIPGNDHEYGEFDLYLSSVEDFFFKT